MRNILRQPAPRIQEDKPSGLDAHFEYIDAYMVKKNGLRRPSGGLRGPLRGAAPRLRLVVLGRTTSRTPIVRPGSKYCGGVLCTRTYPEASRRILLTTIPSISNQCLLDRTRYILRNVI